MNNCRDLSKKFDATREEQEKTRGAEGGKLWGKVAAQFFLKVAWKRCVEIFVQNCAKKLRRCDTYFVQNCGITFAKNCA